MGLYEVSAINVVNIIISHSFPKESQIHHYGLFWAIKSTLLSSYILKGFGITLSIALSILFTNYSPYYYIFISLFLYLITAPFITTFAFRQNRIQKATN